MKRKLRNVMLLAITVCGSQLANAQYTYENKIPIPPLIDVPVGDTIKLDMQMFYNYQFNPADPTDSLLNGISATQNGLESWAYNYTGDPQYMTTFDGVSQMELFGPTLVWHHGKQTNIQVTNSLNQPTTSHWHGAEVPASMDGGPHQPIEIDSTWNVNFEDRDGASTMWYHPHYHDNTYPQVQAGLSGLIISRDSSNAIENQLPRTYGIDDIPVIISDTQIKKQGDSLFINRGKSKRPHNVVNGVTNPYVLVPPHMVRLRVLNGSTRKGIRFSVDTIADGNGGAVDNFYQVATDGGYVMESQELTSVLLGPGARSEIVVDFSSTNQNGYNIGDTVYLRNMKDWMGYDVIGSPHDNPGILGGGGKDTTTGHAFLAMIIVPDTITYNFVDSAPNFTSSWSMGLQDTSNVVRTRLKTLEGRPNEAIDPIGPAGFTINGTPMNMMTVNDVVCVDTKEIWEVHNNTIVAHPFHIHKIFFRILDIKDKYGVDIDLDELGVNGPKDDILIREGWTVRFLGSFEGYGDPQYATEIDHSLSYMYHCHILTHEDAQGGGMMHQFVVTTDSICQAIAGIEDVTFEEQKDFLLVPNPAQNQVSIHGYSYEPTSVRIVGLNGNISKRQELAPFDGEASLDITGLPKGFYIVQWATAKGTISKKLMIQ